MALVRVRLSKSVISVIPMLFVTVPGVLAVTHTARVQVAPAAILTVGLSGPTQEIALPFVFAERVPPWQLADLVAFVVTPAKFKLDIVMPVGR